MALKFSNTNNVYSNGVKILLYGSPGVGKTTLLATVPRCVIISAEKGLLSIAGSNQLVIEVSDLTDLTDAYNWLVQNPQHYDSVAIDSISELGEIVLHALKSKYNDARLAYTELSDKVLDIVRRFRDLQNKNVIMVAKAGNVKEELTGALKYFPTLPGTKLANALPYQFDEVLYLSMKNEIGQAPVRFVQTGPDFQVTAKDRSGTLNLYERPNLGDIISKCQSRALQAQQNAQAQAEAQAQAQAQTQTETQAQTETQGN